MGQTHNGIQRYAQRSGPEDRGAACGGRFTVRPLEERDLPALLALYQDVAHERLWLGTEPGFDAVRYVRGWRKMIAGQWGTSFVAVENGELLGQIAITPHDEYGWVVGMAVDARSRRKGVGAKLLDAAVAWAKTRHLPSISLLVFPHNEGARALYRKAGFDEIERFENDVTRQSGEIWDTILMRKILG